MSILKEILSDNEGHASSTRLVWSISVLLIIFTWSYICIKDGVLHSFTTGDALWLATLFGGKVGQSLVERKFPTNGNGNGKPKIEVSVEQQTK